MAHHDQALVDASRQQVMHLGEVAQAVLRHLVVVALDEDLLALQPGKVPAVVAPGEVADNVDEILGRDGPVPVGDDRLVHLLDRAERTAAMPADVVVSKVKVRGEEHIHFRRPRFFPARAAGGHPRRTAQ